MNERYNVVILGAGVNGLASAKALAEEGKSVLVIEKGHIGSGASSRSSRLIHGGLRYLEHYEFSLVREALRDQKYLLETYPELVRLRAFYLPIYQHSNRPAWVIRLGLWLYSFFSRHGGRAVEVPKEEFLRSFRGMKEEGLKAVFRYFDAQTDDLALTLAVAREAETLGVEILEHTRIEDLEVDKEHISISLEGKRLRTPLLINATGAWVDEVNERYKLPSSFTIEKLSGIHLVIDRLLVPEPLILETGSKRIFFILPQKETTLIGTTERSESSEVDKIRVNNEDIEYLLRESNTYLKTALKRKDIREVFIGVRPIIKSQKDPSRMSREYKLDLHRIGESRVLHIYGGKLTTFPSLAKKVVSRLKKSGLF